MSTNTKDIDVTDEEIRQLVVERLKAFPSGKKISIGSDGEYSKDELISAIDHHEPIGQKIIDIQMAFLQSLKEGALFND